MNVRPHDDKDYVDSFYASMYQTVLSCGQGEVHLIWTRYAGFLALHGLILNALVGFISRALDRRWQNIDTIVVITLALCGALTSVIWHILNHRGWLYQNYWYGYAADFEFEKLKIELPMSKWKEETSLPPRGLIYNIAQVPPVVLYFLYSCASCYFGQKAFGGLASSIIITFAITLLSVVICQYIKNHEIASTTKMTKDRRKK